MLVKNREVTLFEASPFFSSPYPIAGTKTGETSRRPKFFKEKASNAVSIVIPTRNEAGSLRELIERIDQALVTAQISYEVIIVDDYSSDATREIAYSLSRTYPVSVHLKKGKLGKSYSLLEGFTHAMYDRICIIDADLQYPPEAIPAMLAELDENVGVVVGKRRYQNVPFLRKAVSHSFQYLFVRLLHGLQTDVQSGLKVFKKEILPRVKLDPTPWTFDLEFLLESENAGFRHISIPIDFVKRSHGTSKVSTLKTSWEIGIAAIRSKLRSRQVITSEEESREGSIKRYYFKGKKYAPFSDVPPHQSAIFTLTHEQRMFLLLSALCLLAGLLLNWRIALATLLGCITFVYSLDLLQNLLLIVRTIRDGRKRERKVSPQRLPDHLLPLYTILCPLYKEASVLKQFTAAIDALDYPKDKLEVLLLLEDDDEETIREAKRLSLSHYIRPLIVSHSLPKTKPKACNVGLRKARGEFIVIYDAEDKPDPKQLRDVVSYFQSASSEVVCVQAKLNFYNKRQNILTRLFTAEYSLWFDLILPALQAFHAPIPLGGTSNHFKTRALRKLGGWDAFNVTEDCDLGVRLFRYGMKTAIINSYTLEEANSSLGNWINQRSRWVKGYMQTYLVHTRGKKHRQRYERKSRFFHLLIGGKILSLLCNPILWLLSASYFLFRPYTGPFIESLFPSYIFYFGVLSFVFGNFLYLYYYMIALIKNRHDSLVGFVYLVPFYWLFMSVASYVALYRLITNPHHWSKTRHGLHLPKNLSVSL